MSPYSLHPLQFKHFAFYRQLLSLSGLFIAVTCIWQATHAERNRLPAVPETPAQVRETVIAPTNTQSAGSTLAVSGATLVVGAPLDDSAGTDAGAALVYVRAGDTWLFQAKLTAQDAAAGDKLGSAVSIDGDTVALGMSSNTGRGAVYVFTRNGNVWTQQARITPEAQQEYSGFGFSLALSGNTLAVGDPFRPRPGVLDDGAIHIFIRNGTSWTRQTKLTNPTSYPKLFSYAVALQGDTLVASAAELRDVAQPSGEALVYTRSNGVWSAPQDLPRTNNNDGIFGHSVATDGNTIVIAATVEQFAGSIHTPQEIAYVYTRHGPSWSVQRLNVSGSLRNIYNHSLPPFAVAVQGDFLVFGTIEEAYLFRRIGTDWRQHTRLIPNSSPAQINFGVGVATDGTRAFVGAPNNGNGTVYVYDDLLNLQTPTITLTTAPNPSASVEPVNCTVNVRDANGSPASGKVQLYVDGTPRFAPVAFTNGVARINFQSSELALGRRSLRVVYSGSNAVRAGDSNTVIQDTAGGSPLLSLNSASVIEGQAGTTQAVFVVGLTLPSEQAVTVNYATSNGTATAGSDYQATSSTLTFQPGETRKLLSVNVVGDTTPEPDETFTVTLSNANGALLAGGPGLGTIVNDDVDNAGRPGLFVSDVVVTEGNTGTVNATFAIVLSRALTQSVTTSYYTHDSTAQGGNDYQILTGTVTFAPGETVKTVSVPVFGDVVKENDEAFALSLFDYPATVFGASVSGRGLIVNDDWPIVQFLYSMTDLYELYDTNYGFFYVTVSGEGRDYPVSVDYSTNDNFALADCSVNNGVARQNCDYVPARGTLHFAPGETQKQIFVPVINDYFVDPGETFQVTLSNLKGGLVYGAQRSMTAVIADNDLVAPNNSRFVGELRSVPEVGVGSNTYGTLMLNPDGLTAQTTLAYGGDFYAGFIHGPSQPEPPTILVPALFNIGTTGAAITLTPAQSTYLRDGLLYVAIQSSGQQIAQGQLLQNPLDHPRFFVRQQYYDFLSREPDFAGGDYWLNQIKACDIDVSCIRQRRIGISAAFFIEQEFQESGAYVFRLYKAAFGEQAAYRPTFAQFLPDRARVVGGVTLEQGKLDFANLFVRRLAFLSRYPIEQPVTQFVDAILATVQQGSGVTFTVTERQGFINDANTGGRGLMLKNLADNVAFKQAVYNRAFVLMQYFGYLRRDPDQAGYDFWLNALNQQPNNFRGMVCAFLTATEYQQRFSPVATRSNQECQTP